MKKLIITIGLLIFSNLIFSQDTIWLPSRIERSYEDEFGTYQYTGVFSYDENGLLTQFTNRFGLNGGYYYRYYYDDEGHETNYARWGSSSGSGASSYSYDSISKSYENGLLKQSMRGSRTYPFWDFQWRSKDEYQYDGFGRCILVESYNPNNLTLMSMTTYEYNDNGEQIENYALANGEVQRQKIRRYNEHGKLMDLVVKTLTDGELLNSTHTAYEYQNGLLTRTLQQVWSVESDTWVNTTLVSKTIDNQGFLAEELKLNWNDEIGQFDNVMKAVYENDSLGHCLSMQEYAWTNGEWVSVNGYVNADMTLFFGDDLALEDQLARADDARCYPNAAVSWDAHPNNALSFPILGSEWYYEIHNENGSVTYQHLEYAADTTVGGKKAKVLVRTNHIYDKQEKDIISREIIYEKDNVVYWWNDELQQFTVLYDFEAVAGDFWVTTVGHENLFVYVHAVEQYEYEGEMYRMLCVSDVQGLFNGNIVCGIGHLTSFFPERLMTQEKGYGVEGIRCCWKDGDLVFKCGDRDCDEVFQAYHGVDEVSVEAKFKVYPNPTDDLLYVETVHAPSLQWRIIEYRIINPMGQTLMTGCLYPESKTIDVSALPSGMYLIIIGDKTQKFCIANR